MQGSRFVRWLRGRDAHAAPAGADHETHDVARDPEPVACRFDLGHYYSPLPDNRELAREPRHSQVWPTTPRATPGIDWNADGQRRLVTEVFAGQGRLEFADDESGDATEYWTGNDQYPPLDAWVLEAFLRELRPARTIEIGSGFSSLVTARVNRELLGGSMAFTCIDPYPRQVLLDGVQGITDVRVEQVQDTPLSLFDELDERDVLFVDTSHTVKTGGDVVWIYGEIIPRLRPGVVVHIHDAFLPGDYPEQWVREGWGWNEVYLIHGFLTFNSAFEVLFGAQWMLHHASDAIEQAFPGFARHREGGGASLWMRRR